MRPIVIVSSWSKSVSFTGVLRHVMAALGERPIYLVALDWGGDVCVEGNVTIIPGRCDGYEIRKAHLIYEVARRIRPAAVFYYFDLFAAQYHYPALLEIQRNLAPVVMYMPIDGTLNAIHPLRATADFERLVFFTEAARQRFIDLNADIQEVTEDEPLQSRCCTIPHGVSRTDFFPIKGGRLIAKQRAFPDHPELAHVPIVLNGNHPWERKRLDLTLDGFARFLHKSRRDVYLYLHLPGASDDDVTSLERTALALGIRRSVVLGGAGWTTVEGLNWIYNACEVGINTAMGEGWGLVSCEHGAAGAAQIVPDDEQQREIWGSSAAYAATIGSEGSWACPHVYYRVVDAESVARALEALFSDDAFLQERSHLAMERMGESCFDWTMIEQQWASLFTGVFESRSHSTVV